MNVPAQVVTHEEFANIQIGKMLFSRHYTRDIFYSIHYAMIFADMAIIRHIRMISILNTEEASGETIEIVQGFKAKDDSNHLYFFPHEWPSPNSPFLKKDDIIPSDINGLDLSIGNLRRALRVLREEGASFRKHFSIEELSSRKDLLQMLVTEEIRNPNFKWSEGIFLTILIDSLYALRLAINNQDERAIKEVGTISFDFTKPIKRTNGFQIELYNSARGEWQLCPGEYDASFNKRDLIEVYKPNQIN